MNIKIGDRYGRLTVTGISTTRKNYVICSCGCGNTKEIKISTLHRVRSCGCIRKEIVSLNGKRTIKENSKKQTQINSYFNTNFQVIESSIPPKNNTSGIKGVIWNKNHKKWEAYISLHGKRKYLGNYDSKREAEEARTAAETKYYIPLINQKKLIENTV